MIVVILVILGHNVCSLCSIGIFGGFLLAEQFGFAGWIVAGATAVLYAQGTYVDKLAKALSPGGYGWLRWSPVWWVQAAAVGALVMLSAGMGVGRINHGLVAAHERANLPRRTAMADLEACKAGAIRAKLDAVASIPARSAAPTRLTEQAIEREAKEFAKCEADIPVPPRVPMPRIADLGLTDWSFVLAPVVYELGFGLLIKAIGTTVGLWLVFRYLRRRDPEAQPEVVVVHDDAPLVHAAHLWPGSESPSALFHPAPAIPGPTNSEAFGFAEHGLSPETVSITS